MRKLIERDITAIIGIDNQEYIIEAARIKQGHFTDSDHYGIVLGKNLKGHYVTWEFHLDEAEKPTMYWGHYFMEDREAALKDFDTRDLGSSTVESEPCPLNGDTANDCDGCVYSGDYCFEDGKCVPRNLFEVTIAETLKLTVQIKARNQQEAEQIVSDNWYDSEYILGAENFVDVEFMAVPRG